MSLSHNHSFYVHWHKGYIIAETRFICPALTQGPSRNIQQQQLLALCWEMRWIKMPKSFFAAGQRARASASKARLIIPNKEDGRRRTRCVCVRARLLGARPDKGQRRRRAAWAPKSVRGKVQRGSNDTFYKSWRRTCSGCSRRLLYYSTPPNSPLSVWEMRRASFGSEKTKVPVVFWLRLKSLENTTPPQPKLETCYAAKVTLNSLFCPSFAAGWKAGKPAAEKVRQLYIWERGGLWKFPWESWGG